MKNVTVSLPSQSREILLIITTFFVAATFFIALNSWATTIGTNVDTSVFNASSTAHISGNINGGANLFIGGTTTQSMAAVAFGTATAGTNIDAYISGGLGVNNATSADGDFVVGTSPLLSFTKNGRLVVGATSTGAVSGISGHKFIFDGGQAIFSSGSTATATLSILNEASADGTNACIEMSTDGITYRVFINSARTGLTAEAGSCGGN
ncbi:MAG: hypothetical protein AAB417_00080 [Patescibacteria group bacterium]